MSSMSINRKNFLDVFGYLELSLPTNFPYDDFIRDVNCKSSQKFSMEWSEILRQNRSFGILQYVDQSEIAS